MVELYEVDIRKNLSEVPGLEALLEPGELERAEDFSLDLDRRRFVLMRAILRLVISRKLGIQAPAIHLETGRYGKPGIAAGIEFNLSYSGSMGLVAVARVPVGVDIDKVVPGRVTGNTVRRVFSPEEQQAFFPGRPGTDAGAFFRGWVRKEATVKASGRGLSYPLSLVDSRLKEESFLASCGGSQWWTTGLGNWRPDYEAALSIAWMGVPPAISLTQITSATLTGSLDGTGRSLQD